MPVLKKTTPQINMPQTKRDLEDPEGSHPNKQKKDNHHEASEPSTSAVMEEIQVKQVDLVQEIVQQPPASPVKGKGFLYTSCIQDLIAGNEHQHVIVLLHNSTVREAMRVLGKNHILSAPVLLAGSVEDSEHDVFMGIIDMMSLTHAILRDVVDKVDEEKLSTTQKWDRLAEDGDIFGDRLLITVCGNDAGMTYKGNLNYSLEILIKEAFLNESSSGPYVHRVAIFNDRGKITHIISQSDVVEYVVKNYENIGDIVEKSLEELGLVRHNVICVQEDDITAEAFHVIDRQGVTAVGVVNKYGHLVDNISSSDLRGMDLGNLSHLLFPVRKFLEIERPHLNSRHSRRGRLVTCHASDTFGAILKRLVETKVHRIYVVDKEKNPIGLISLTDVLRTLVYN